MCTLCDGFKNKVSGMADIDNRMINSEENMSLWVAKRNEADVRLMVSLDGVNLFEEPIDYCPKCGKRMTLVEDGIGPEPDHEDWAIRHGYF